MKLTLASALILPAMTAAALAQDIDALSAEGRAMIQEFGGALKSELLAAVEAGGPAHAVSVCNLRAPEIAAETAGNHPGWTIARSSHRLRNPQNVPDAYTAAAIEAFLERAAAGEPVADLARAGIVEEGDARVFRMVKAIPTGALCLNCHGGSEVKPDVEAVLSDLYPEDEARGFAEGDMRGVFTLRKVL